MKIQALYLLTNTIQNYTWGSLNGISQITGTQNIDQKPMAEMWMGAHPLAPSLLEHDGKLISLNNFIALNPELLLGSSTAKTFVNTLPFLFKILSAQTPLSLQVHPSLTQAKHGFKKENSLEIPLHAFNRNYKDANHKPEIMLALSPFKALCGFRPFNQILDLFALFPLKKLQEIKNSFTNSKNYVLLYKNLLEIHEEEAKGICTQAVIIAQSLVEENKDFYTKQAALFILHLAQSYPFDLGILAPLYLNCLEFNEGQAIFLPAGIIHAYIQGTGLELMANSDNVMRGGLTSKYIDKTELLSILDNKTYLPQILEIDVNKSTSSYQTPAKEFVLSKLQIEPSLDFVCGKVPHIILCTEGSGDFFAQETKISFTKGDSFFVPASTQSFFIQGTAILYDAKVPEQKSP